MGIHVATVYLVKGTFRGHHPLITTSSRPSLYMSIEVVASSDSEARNASIELFKNMRFEEAGVLYTYDPATYPIVAQYRQLEIAEAQLTTFVDSITRRVTPPPIDLVSLAKEVAKEVVKILNSHESLTLDGRDVGLERDEGL